jgi:hypothetical protein
MGMLVRYRCISDGDFFNEHVYEFVGLVSLPSVDGPKLSVVPGD